MSHINRKKKTLTTKRKTNRASQHDLENNTSMFESFVSVRSSKQQQDVLSSSQQSSICPISRENEDDIFAFPKKSCLSDPNKTAQTEISPQENIFDEETKVEISILDSSKLKPEEQYQLNDSSLFFESDTKKKFVPNSPVCKDSCGLNEDVDDNDDTVPIPDGSNETKASVSETNLPEEKNPDSEDNNQCPVCLKTVGVAKYLSHIKSCAAKNKLSTQQLLSALQLHKKQLAERKELGLGIPVQSYRAKVSPKRSRTNNARKGPVDSSLQLALALSASLHSAQEVEVIQEAEALKEAGLSEEAEQKLSTLEKYGFASDFPIQSTSVAGGSKCRPLPSSLLLRRTQEDRERIVTEKVAIVLITEEESVNFNPFTQMEPTLKSKRLKEKWNSDCYLWRKSLCPESEERDAFYVKSLAKFVSPSKAEVGEGLRRLSQLPGRMNTPEKDDIGDLLTPSKETASNCYKQDIANLPTPLAMNRGKNIDISSGHQMNSSFSSCSSLTEDWAKLVNKEVLSDIKIRCKDSVVIPAHKLVFYVRCPRILDEIEKKGNDRDLLEWESVTAESVLAFLEFVYSGKTDKLLLLEDSDISSVKTIADRLGYNQLKDKLGEMQSLSESKKADVKKNLFDVPVDHKNNIRDSIADYFNSGDLSQTDSSFSSLHGSGKNCEEMFSNTPAINSNSRNVNCGRESPDLFADSGVTNIADDSLQEREELDILVSLIGKPTQQGVGKNKWSNDEEQEEIMVVESPLGTSKSLQDVAILRGVSTGKRKASTITFSDDEETSLSKKHCSKNNESFENSCRDDAFDLTRDSNPPSVEEIDHGNNKNSSEGSVKCTSQNSKMKNQYEEETLDLTQSSKSSDDEVCESSRKSSRMSLDELDSRDSMDDLTQKKSVLENSKTDYCQDSDKDMSSISNSISKSQINNDQRELSDSLDDLTQKTVDESVSKNDPKSCDRLHNESHSFNVSTPSKSPAKFVKDDFIGDISMLCTPEARHIKNNSSKASSDYKSQLSKSSRSLTNTSFKEVQGDALNDGNYDQYYNDPIWDGYDDYYHFNYEAHTSFQTPIKNLKAISSTSEKSRSKPLSSPKVCTTDTSLTKALQKKLSQETSPICSSYKSIKSISSDNSEKSPQPMSQKRLTPSSSGSIKYIASSDSKSPKHLSQSLSNSPSPRKALGTCHNLSINDSEVEVVPDMNSPNTLDSLKSRKNLAFEFVTESSKSKNICPEDLRHLGKDAENVATSPGNTLNVRKESYLKKDSLEAMQRLLDDSFEVNNSLLDAADALASGNRGESKSTSGDAVTAGHSTKSSLDTPSPGIIVSDKVTPLADYSAMKTPTLKKELSRFGLKPSLDRRKAKLLLRYIYDQTHPVVPDCEQGRGEFRQPEGRPPRSPRKANVAVVATGKPRSPSRSPKKPETVTLNDSDSETEETCSQMSTSSSISSSASLPEESYHEPEDILTQDLTEKGDVRSAIRKLITGDLQLHRKVLMYEPIQLEELMARLKTNGIKSKTNDVMDFLDEQCITFRTNSWKATNEKRRQKSPKKKKSQNAGPSGSPLKDKAPFVKKRGRPKKTNSENLQLL